ncbi:hypothetical protein ES703_87786 [subsurface metagenome]
MSCGVLIFTDTLQCQPQSGVSDIVGSQQREHENDKHVVINNGGLYYDDVPASNLVYMVFAPQDNILDKLRESESEHDEIHAPQPQRQSTGQKGQTRTD